MGARLIGWLVCCCGSADFGVLLLVMIVPCVFVVAAVVVVVEATHVCCLFCLFVRSARLIVWLGCWLVGWLMW